MGKTNKSSSRERFDFRHFPCKWYEGFFMFVLMFSSCYKTSSFCWTNHKRFFFLGGGQIIALVITITWLIFFSDITGFIITSSTTGISTWRKKWRYFFFKHSTCIIMTYFTPCKIMYRLRANFITSSLSQHLHFFKVRMFTPILGSALHSSTVCWLESAAPQNSRS